MKLKIFGLEGETECAIEAPHESDYGYYGKTGTFKAKELPTSKCACKVRPKLKSDYDDTPGHKDIFFTLFCPKCKKHVGGCNLDSLIDQWNIYALRDHVCEFEGDYFRSESISLWKGICYLCEQRRVLEIQHYSPAKFENDKGKIL